MKTNVRCPECQSDKVEIFWWEYADPILRELRPKFYRTKELIETTGHCLECNERFEIHYDVVIYTDELPKAN